MAEKLFREIRVTQQKDCNGVIFPKILSLTNIPCKVSGLTDSIKASKSWLELQLHQSGAILFRGFPLVSASDFNDFVEAFGFEPLPYVGGAAIRTHVIGHVFTANESPLDQKIPFHHEMAVQPEFPSKLFFFCETEPVSGGETPVVLSHIIYDKMKERHPSFVQQLEEVGLIYTRVLSEDDDPSSPVGLGWKSKFSTSDKCIAQERAAKLGATLKWKESGAVEVKIGPIPGVRYDKSRNRKTWFNMLVSAIGGFENELNDDPAKAVTFGDGQPLPAHIVHDCCKILDEECVAIPWLKGDVLMLDNLAVLHARLPLITPPRRILASLCK
ncbi:hypothetical protein CTI12_AA558300 [Artemisia annua]|uniref:TauD/TfdA-like domain-containing protein n=1 Tax=Artemisia annua TaxID=35608 RepID=A0A2U1KW11_ARTAN|nr:hypothetical protein CTI12_AA558300 [Artemisia annua]